MEATAEVAWSVGGAYLSFYITQVGTNTRRGRGRRPGEANGREAVPETASQPHPAAMA